MSQETAAKIQSLGEALMEGRPLGLNIRKVGLLGQRPCVVPGNL